MTLPNFLIVGAQKAGTTSVYEYLSQHPDVFMSTPKEPHFFTYMTGDAPSGGHHSPFYKPQRRVTEVHEYESLFANANGALAIGEASPSYLYSPHVAERISGIIPDSKIIAILRNPVERAFSNFQMNERLGQEPLKTFEAALAAEDDRVANDWGYAWHYFRKGLYDEQVVRYRQHFAQDQLLVTLHDDLVRDPAGFVRQLFTFLNVDPSFSPNLAISSNVSGVPRSRVLGTLLKPALMVHHYWSPFVPRKLRHTLRGKLLVRARMQPDTRSALVDRYRSSIASLEALIDRDLSNWLR